MTASQVRQAQIPAPRLIATANDLPDKGEGLVWQNS